MAPLEAPLRQLFQEDSGHTVRFVFGSSGMLARQIENGAPYDVYLSANEKFVHDLAVQGRVDPARVVVYALGRVAVWSKSGQFGSLSSLRAARRIAIANPAHAPYGIAARGMLERAGLWAELERRIVYGENVRQALQYAESGNVDAVLTAWSLVHDRGGVLVPAELHDPIRQAGGVVASSRNRKVVEAFLALLGSKIGRALLERNGLFAPE